MTRKDPAPGDPSATTDVDGEDFLARWSRRKAQARTPAPDLGQTPAAPPAQTPDAAGAAAGAEQPPLCDADMPPLDTLTAESDVSGFFSPGVSEELRRHALRKIFSLAVYNVRDGLDDYDDDFTQFQPLGDTVTADMKHRAERLAARREREAAERRQALAGSEAGPDIDAGAVETEAADEATALADAGEDSGGEDGRGAADEREGEPQGVPPRATVDDGRRDS